MDPEKAAKLDEALGFLSEYIQREGGYVAGKHLTIADISVAATISTIDAAGHDLSKFSNVLEYFKKLQKEIDGYEELNQKGIDEFTVWVKAAQAK